MNSNGGIVKERYDCRRKIMVDFRDDELKKWLAEEYEKEIDEMEEVLFPNGVLPDDGETEEEAKAAYKKLVDRLKADGVYEEDEPEKVKIVYLPEKKRHKAAKVAAAVLVCAAGVFAASMTSQANRSYFIDSVKVWTGNDTKISVDNDPSSDVLSMDEDKARDDINEQLGMKVPYFMYRPSGLEFLSCDVNKQLGYACIEYICNKTILLLQIDDNIENKNSRAYSLDGKKIAQIKFSDEDIEVTVMKIKDEADEKENYVAYWQKENFFYEISGKLEEKEFIKIVQNMRF